MKYPTLSALSTSREVVDVFGGYNHNLRIGRGEMYDMTNLSSDNYPILSPRQKRGIYATPSKPLGLISKDKLCYVDGTDIVIGDERIDLELSNEYKSMISMGAYIIIMPDKKYINTKDTSDHGDIEASVKTTTVVNYEITKADGGKYDKVTIQATAPASPSSMDIWIDTSVSPHQMKQYSTSAKEWVAIASTYVKISAEGIGVPFKADDVVTLSGVKEEVGLNGSHQISAREDDYIVVTGIIGTVNSQSDAITVERRMPNLDFVVESNNRLWGCRYGEDVNGNMVNEIYASKLGDFKNWNVFQGISTDSYVASVGTDGAFTGAITHLGYPLFFKENCLHKVYGNYPSNYQIQTTACRGVQEGCSKSLAIVNEILFYKARSGVCAYDGSLPQEISLVLGEGEYGNAVGGVLGNKYYISMCDESEEYRLFVYDTARGLWHKEDNTQVKAFSNYRGELYYIDYANNQIKTVKGTGTVEPNDIRWEAITGTWCTDSPDSKYISRMVIRMSLTANSRVIVSCEYDSSGEWEHLFTMAGINLNSFSIPVKPKRCDHLRLRIEGIGEAKIYSICSTIERGSDR
jgi:hypothetical protein